MSRRLFRRRRRVVAAAIRPASTGRPCWSERPYPPPDHRQQLVRTAAQIIAVAASLAQVCEFLARVVRGH